jgi:hypothetical protein
MAIVYVYNQDTNRVERYERGDREPMPYNENGTLTVGEFRGRSCSHILWTDKRTMESWNITRARYGGPIPVGYAFRRIWEGGHAAQSQHYAGTAFDVAQALNNTQRAQLRNIARRTGAWGYVEPAELTPTWVHFDRRTNPPACSAGYPLLRQGSKNTYVFVLQDALSTLGYAASGLDGVFGGNTRASVMNFQRSNGLASDGVVGCNTWTALTRQALGMGSTQTTLSPCWG